MLLERCVTYQCHSAQDYSTQIDATRRYTTLLDCTHWRGRSGSNLVRVAQPRARAQGQDGGQAASRDRDELQRLRGILPRARAEDAAAKVFRKLAAGCIHVHADEQLVLQPHVADQRVRLALQLSKVYRK